MKATRTLSDRPKGMTARQILRRVKPEVLARAREVRVLNLKARITDYGLEYFAQTQSAGKGKARYTTSVTLLDPKTRHVFLDCTCPYHPYWGAEYNLYEKNAARIIRSNGQSPDLRDPTRENIACKHSVALLQYLIQHRRV